MIFLPSEPEARLCGNINRNSLSSPTTPTKPNSSDNAFENPAINSASFAVFDPMNAIEASLTRFEYA